MERWKRKEIIQIKINEIKEKSTINSLKNLRFKMFVDEQTINKIAPVLEVINGYNAKAEKIIFKVNDYETNIENLKKVIEEVQKFGNWFIPSPVSKKWYEVEVDDIKLGIQELFKLYGEDFFTIILKEENTLIDVFWDEEYEGINNEWLGIYCIYIKTLCCLRQQNHE